MTKFVVIIYPINQPQYDGATFPTYRQACSFLAEMWRQGKRGSINKRSE